MIPFKDYISEKFINLDGQKVFENPSLAEIQSLMGEAKGDREWNIRYIIDGGKIYVWDAFQATHLQMGKKLGIDFDYADRTKYLGGCGGFEKKWDVWSHFGYWENDNPRLKKYENLFNIAMPREKDGSASSRFQTINKEVKVAAHIRDGSPVHSYTRTFPNLKLHENLWDKVLLEKVIQLYDGFKVYVNPGVIALKQLLKDLQDAHVPDETDPLWNDGDFQKEEYAGHVRYLVDAEGNIYVWDSWGKIHSDMARELGIQFGGRGGAGNGNAYGGYFGYGKTFWNLCNADYHGDPGKSNPPETDTDFWQLGPWPRGEDQLPRLKRFEEMARITPSIKPSYNKAEIDALYKELNPKTPEDEGMGSKGNWDVHVSAHTRDGTPVHAYTRSRPTFSEGFVKDRYKAWRLNRKYPNEVAVGKGMKHANKNSELAGRENASGAPHRFYLKPDEDLNKDIAANEFGGDKSYQRSKEVQKRRASIHSVREEFSKFILEKITDVNGVKVYINPPISDLKTLLQKKTMRYMIHNDTVYTWDANEYIHGEMADELGLDEDGFKGGMPNWFDNSGYWGLGMDRFDAAKSDIMPTVWDAAIKPKGDGDFWQVGGWISSPRTVKYELPMHIRGTGRDEFMKLRKRDIEANDIQKGGKVHVHAYSRGRNSVIAHDRSYPYQHDWGDEDGPVYEGNEE